MTVHGKSDADRSTRHCFTVLFRTVDECLRRIPFVVDCPERLVVLEKSSPVDLFLRLILRVGAVACPPLFVRGP